MVMSSRISLAGGERPLVDPPRVTPRRTAFRALDLSANDRRQDEDVQMRAECGSNRARARTHFFASGTFAKSTSTPFIGPREGLYRSCRLLLICSIRGAPKAGR